MVNLLKLVAGREICCTFFLDFQFVRIEHQNTMSALLHSLVRCVWGWVRAWEGPLERSGVFVRLLSLTTPNF